MGRRGRAAAAVVCVWLLLAGCGRAAAGGQVLHIDWGADPPGLNPITTDNSVSFDVLDQVMEGLTRLNGQGVPQPGIASSWQVSPNGLTYTFQLRAARWSNGATVQAADFVYAWQQALDPRNGALDASELQYIAGASALLNYQLPDPHKHPTAYAAAGKAIAALEAKVGVSAPNPHTLVVTLARPTPFWLGLTSLPVYFPADPAAVQGWGMSAYGSTPQDLLYDGPFVITSWVHGQHLDLGKNPDYWDARAVHLTAVDGVMVGNAATVDNLWQTGQLDVLTSIPAAYLPTLSTQPGFHSAPEAQTWYLQVNVGQPGLNQVDVRQALSLAIDRASFAAQVVPGSSPAYAFTPPTIQYAPGKPFSALVGKVLSTTADPALARSDLAAGLRAAGLSHLPQLTLLVPDLSTATTEAAALQAMFQQNLGVQVRVQSADLTTYLQLLQQGKFSLALTGWGADYNDPTTFLDLFTASSPYNTAHWNDPAFGADLQAAGGAPTAARRGGDLAAAEKELLAQLPAIPLYWPDRDWIAQPAVHGMVFYLTGPDFSLKDVSLQ